MVFLKTQNEIAIMSVAGKMLAGVLVKLKAATVVGETTIFLDNLAFRLIKEAGAEPAFLNYRPAGAKKAYPFTLCASLNDCVVHGLPSDYIIRDGDVVKLDLGLKYKEFYVDSAITVGVGNISKDVRKLISVTEESLRAGIKNAKPGKTLGDVGSAIQKIVEDNGFSVVRSLIGHGIGRNLHEDPPVPNFGRPGDGETLEEGMVIAIEPMVAMGSGATRVLKDDSFVTADGSLAAHWEHTVAITSKGQVVLTTL